MMEIRSYLDWTIKKIHNRKMWDTKVALERFIALIRKEEKQRAKFPV